VLGIARLLDDPGIVRAPGTLGAGDDRAGFERVKCGERRQPFLPELGIGFSEIQVNVVVGGIARDDEPDVGHMQRRRTVGVGVCEFDRHEFVPLKVEGVVVERLRENEPVRDLPGKPAAPQPSHCSGVDPSRMYSTTFGTATAPASGKAAKTAPSPNSGRRGRA
jgi:hypothetical protein